MPPMHFAAALGHVHIMEALVAAGADPDEAVTVCNDVGMRPLHYAAIAGVCVSIKFLLSRGCSINSPCGWGKTPLNWAVSKTQVNAVKLLLERGASPNVSGPWDYSVLSCVIGKGSSSGDEDRILSLLFQYGATPTDKELAGLDYYHPHWRYLIPRVRFLDVEEEMV